MTNTSKRVTVQTEEFVEIEMEIKDIPFLRETMRKDKNGASVYEVPAGMKVLTTTTDGNGARWADITTLTVEDGCSLRKLVTSEGKEVTVSANESVAVFDPILGLKKVCPDDTKDCLVPTILERPVGTEGTFDLGWVLGFWLSDGNISESLLILTKENDHLRTIFLEKLGVVVDNPHLVELAHTYSEFHDAATNAGISGTSRKLHLNTKFLPASFTAMLSSCYPSDLDWTAINRSNRSCLYKQFPTCVRDWNKDALLGLLCGLITGDGSIRINTSKDKPQLTVKIDTSSKQLRDDIIWLGSCLGFRMTYSTTKPSENRLQKHDSYTIPVSTPVLKRYMDKLFFAGMYEEELKLLETVKENTKDIVPVSFNVLQLIHDLTDEQRGGLTKSTVATSKSQANKAAYNYTSIIRSNAQRYVTLLRQYILPAELPEKLRREVELFCTVVEDTSTGWEKIKSVTEVPTETVYDIAVPDTKVFALSNGLIVFDTINVHVPSSDAAVKETYEKLMPSKTPHSDRIPGKIVPLPKQEQILGLYTAATAPSTGKPVVFDTEEEAIAAIRKGQVPLSADVEVRNPRTKIAAAVKEEKEKEVAKNKEQLLAEVGPIRNPKSGQFMPTSRDTAVSVEKAAASGHLIFTMEGIRQAGAVRIKTRRLSATLPITKATAALLTEASNEAAKGNFRPAMKLMRKYGKIPPGAFITGCDKIRVEKRSAGA